MQGKDVTNKVSFLVLEAAHWLKIPANVGIAVGDGVDPELLKRGVEIMFEDKTGVPKFLGVERTAEGYARNGYDIGWGYERAYSGCHWSAIPGREYTLNDCVKINFAAVFEVAWKDMLSTPDVQPSVAVLWERFVHHLRIGVRAIASSLDFHMAYMDKVFPELVLDLLSFGPIEQGVDASAGGVEFVNLCLDGAALATIADSFAALEQRVEKEGRLTWAEIARYIETDWEGTDGERARPDDAQYSSLRARWNAGRCVRHAHHGDLHRTGQGSPDARGPQHDPRALLLGQHDSDGQERRRNAERRRAGDPISARREPGSRLSRKDGAPTAMAVAIANSQPGWGNTAPMQMELDPALSKDEGGIESVANLIKTHFDLGGTQINLNIMDAEKVLEAHKDPSKYPDLVVRVTGFSAYFASLSPEFRQLVVDRILKESEG